MPFLAEITSLLSYILPFLFVLGVVVFIHELGHFLAARWCGVEVETFSIGFGPEIAGFVDGRGTRWRIAAIPLGGYVKFKGDENAASMPSQDDLQKLPDEAKRGNFHAAPLRHRAFIVAAGPLANFMLAFAVFTVWFMLIGKMIVEPRIDAVQAGSPAEKSGLRAGDRVLQIGGTPIQSFDELQRVVMLSAEQELLLLVDRNGVSLPVRVIPELRETKDQLGNTVKVGLLGISRSTSQADIRYERYGFFSAMGHSAGETYFWMKQPIIFIKELIAGRADANQLGGPIGIAQLSGKVASVGFSELIRLTAIISISIGLLNLFPIPILDGGHLLYYGIEAILGRPLSPGAQEIGFKIGLALLLMLMVLATWNDLSRLPNPFSRG